MNWKKLFVYIFLLLNLGVIFWFWHSTSFSLFKLGTGFTFIAIGRIIGLLAVFFVLFQVMLIGRVRYFESVFGLDKMSKLHHWTGFSVIFLIILHPIFLSIGYGITGKLPFLPQLIDFILHYQFVIYSAIALLLFITIVFISIFIMYKRLKYETWYYTHVFIYAAIILAFFHQTVLGGDFYVGTGNIFKIYWYALYIFVLGNLLLFRFIRPLYIFNRYRFHVYKIVHETYNTTSIYIKGRNIENFKVKAGQFNIYRFMAKGLWMEAHPFSISGMSTSGEKYLRITVKNSGDFTAKIQNIGVGTPIIIDGPYGIFTTKIAKRDKFLFIAGGVGITPIKSILEELSHKGKDCILLCGNRQRKDIIFEKEFDNLAKANPDIKITHVLSDDKEWHGEKGFVDRDIIMKYCRDYKHREIYICGPPVMMKKIIDQLLMMHVEKRYMHYEKFSL